MIHQDSLEKPSHTLLINKQSKDFTQRQVEAIEKHKNLGGVISIREYAKGQPEIERIASNKKPEFNPDEFMANLNKKNHKLS